MKGHPWVAGIGTFLVAGMVLGGIAAMSAKDDNDRNNRMAIAAGLQLALTIGAVMYARD